MNNETSHDFSGAAVLVTGGTSGIGHAIASRFAAAGAEVTVTGTRRAAAEYDTALEGVEYRSLRIDDAASVDELAGSLERLDVLVNNAGANLPGGRDEWDPDAFAASVAINLTGQMRLTMAARRLLFASPMTGGASVVNLASMAAFRASTIVPGYASAKAGIVALTVNLANRWASRGVRVNAIAPGLIDTPMTAPMAAFPELLESELAHVPMGRLGVPDEVAAAALFLSSSSASYLTGHTLAVDGGYLAG
jgi:NAD(P)-dependent dehydrogenase (short-subunit alcohol dehydrogenase family)